MNYSLESVDWNEVVSNLSGEGDGLQEPEINTPDAAKPTFPGKPGEEAPVADETQEIKPVASKKEVLKKIAEIESPWTVKKNEKGEEVIARVAPAANTKKSKEKDSEHGINSQDLI